MKHGLYLLLFLVVALMSACMRADDEPILPERPISRLYVSMSDFQTDDTADPYGNLLVIDPADTDEMDQGEVYRTDARGGANIYFDPAVGNVFQSNMNDTTIYILSVSNRGTLAPRGFFGNAALDRIRGIWYHHPSQNLYVVNNQTPTSLFVFHLPMNKRAFTVPTHQLLLGDVRPWGIFMYDDNMLIARTGTNGGVSVYTEVPADTMSNTIQPSASLVVEGASDIRGIAYSKKLDILALSDHNGNRVYVFENASQSFGSSGTITPTRTLSGASTGLSGPIDVTIDERDGWERLYVANALSKTISRFPLLTANGNVAPEAAVVIPHTPSGIHLDARGKLATEAE